MPHDDFRPQLWSKGDPDEIRNLGEKIQFLLSRLRIGEAEFVYDFCKTQRVVDSRTPRMWLERSTSSTGGKTQTPSRANQKKLLDYFTERLAVQAFPPGLLYQDMDEFRDSVEKALRDPARSELRIPVAHRVGRMSERNIKDLCGKYVLFRQSFRDDGVIVQEIVTVAKSDRENYLDVHLYAYPVQRDAILPEVFSGSLFRYGMMYCALVSHIDTAHKDRMRFIQFPEVPLVEGTFYGIVTGHSYHLEEPASVRVVAQKIEDNASYEDKDGQLIRPVTQGTAGVLATLLDNKPELEHILTTNKKDRRLREVRDLTKKILAGQT